MEAGCVVEGNGGDRGGMERWRLEGGGKCQMAGLEHSVYENSQ